jgi:hypothetical protein
MSLEPSLEGDEKAHLGKNLRCKSEKRSVNNMEEIKEPRGAIYVYIETDKEGEFRRLIVKTTHIVEVDVNGTSVVFSNSEIHPISFLEINENELRDIIVKNLEKTLKSVTDKANNLQKAINLLEDLATTTDCQFDVMVNKYDC